MKRAVEGSDNADLAGLNGVGVVDNTEGCFTALHKGERQPDVPGLDRSVRELRPQAEAGEGLAAVYAGGDVLWVADCQPAVRPEGCANIRREVELARKLICGLG